MLPALTKRGLVLAASLAFALPAQAFDLGDLLKGVMGTPAEQKPAASGVDALSQTDINAGLKEALTRGALWEAFLSRRTYALTGDRIALQPSVNDAPMGAQLPLTDRRDISVRVEAGGAMDYLDVIKNNRLLCRFSEDVLNRSE